MADFSTAFAAAIDCQPGPAVLQNKKFYAVLTRFSPQGAEEVEKVLFAATLFDRQLQEESRAFRQRKRKYIHILHANEEDRELLRTPSKNQWSGAQERSSEDRIQLAVDLLAAQKPETLLRLRKFFPFKTAASESVTPRKGSAPRLMPSSLPRIEPIRLNADDFVLVSDVEHGLIDPVNPAPTGYLVRPLYQLKPERQEQIREIAPASVIDLTGIPKEWVTFWNRLNCYGITTKGGLWLSGQNNIRELTAEITLAQILVVPKQFAVSGQLICHAIVSEPVAMVPLKNNYPGRLIVKVDSYEQFLPRCTNAPVLSELLNRRRPLHHSARCAICDL
jgi:hypothetical protein